jgi:hypothetical protein
MLLVSNVTGYSRVTAPHRHSGRESAACHDRPEDPSLKRLAALAAGASLLAAAGVAATGGSASADTVLNVHYALTGTTFINKLSTTVNLGAGTPAATVDLTTGPVPASYAIPFFRHCGLTTLLLNLTIPGSGNTLNVTLGQLQLG